MEHSSAMTWSEPSRGFGRGRATGVELRVWVEMPLRRSRFPIRRKPSVALCRHEIEAQFSSNERAPSLSIEEGLLGIATAFLGLLSLGFAGRGLEVVLLWVL
jgi:hypothetical protein